MKLNKKNLRTSMLLLSMLLIMSLSAQAATAPDLGATANFAVLANTTVASAGISTIFGDVGVSPGTLITGLSPGNVNGSLHPGDALAAQAQVDLALAYNSIAAQAPTLFLTGELGGQTLTPGVYKFNETAVLTGVLILDDQNNPDAVFIFQIGSTLTTSGNGEVRRAGNTNSSIIFWQVGDSATLSSTTTFRGTILALNNIALNNLAAIDGRALARNGAVTLNNNLVEVPQIIRLVNLVPFALSNGTDKLTMMVTITNPPPQGPISDNVFLSSNRTQDAFDVPANQVVTNAAGQAVFNVTSILPGTAKITATTGKNTVSTTVLFLAAAPVLTTINLTPVSATVVVGNTMNFTATALDQFGNVFPAIVTWNSSNTTVGTINAAGMFTALAPGTATIKAFNGTVNGTAAVTVAIVLPVLTAINVTPVLTAVVVGNTTNFTATTLDQFGNVLPAIVTWNSSNITVGTINAAGMFTALTPGDTTIMAFNGTIRSGIATAIVTVTAIVRGCVVDAACTAGAGKPTIVDALFIAQSTVGLRTLTGTQVLAADVNGDGAVNIVDALFIAQFTVGLRPVF